MRLNIESGLIKTPGLVNYWSFNSHIKDIIGGAHLFNGINAGLTNDRFGQPLSALNLNEGSYQIPTGNYFSTGQFTITVWFKLRNYGYWPSIVSLFNGFKIDTIFFGFEASSSIPSFAIFNGNISIANSGSPSAIQLNEWTHLAFTFDQNLNYRFYINASLMSSGSSNQPLKNTTRILNYVGRGDWYPTQPDLDAILDELKIFNRALTQQEIQYEMNDNNY